MLFGYLQIEVTDVTAAYDIGQRKLDSSGCFSLPAKMQQP